MATTAHVRLSASDGVPASPPRWLARIAPSAIVLTAIAVVVALGPLVAAYAPETQSIADRLQSPTVAHPLGTDAFGRDVLARLLAGGRVSLLIGILSMAITVGAGVLIGALAGYAGGKVDALLMRATELVMVFPTFFLIILVVASFGGSVPLLILVIGLTSWPVAARIVRGEVLKIRAREYVLAARALGSSPARVLTRHVVPALAAVVIVSATIRVGTNILIEAGLSYLGLGVQPPLASWGNMVADGAKVMRTEWWLTAIPALAIFGTVLVFNLLGEGLRDLSDPRLAVGRRR